jgi:hypothetical protein
VVEQDFRHLGLTLRSRMTVVRLDDGRLWLHSPVAPHPALVRAVDALGPVCDIVAPNRFHHLWADAWRAEKPEARLLAPPGLAAKRRRLHIDELLDDEPPSRWHGCLGMIGLDGAPRLGEMIFLHRPSRSLILTDLVSNVGPADPWALRVWMRLNGVYGRPGTARAVRLLVRRRRAARDTLRHVLRWEFDRVVVGHGRVIEHAPKPELRRALGWLGLEE